MKMKEYIILFYLQVTYKNEKAQGIVEYALILAFIVGVAVVLFNSNGLANAIGEAFFHVSETINNAMDDSPEAKQKRLQNRMENGLINAIKAGSIEMKAGDWIEIDAQAEYNSKNNGYINGGVRLGSDTLKINGNPVKGHYGGFRTLWDAISSELPRYTVELQQDSGWVGVRIESKGNGNYVSHYYSGSESSPGNVLNYANTTNMNANYRPDGDASDHLWTWTGK